MEFDYAAAGTAPLTKSAPPFGETEKAAQESVKKRVWAEDGRYFPSGEKLQPRQILAISSKSGRSAVNRKAERISKWETFASANVQKFELTLRRGCARR